MPRPELIDLEGMTFGEWTVLSYSHSKRYEGGGRQTMWNCRCSCGAIRKVQAKSLRNLETRRCDDCRLLAVTVPPEERFCKFCLRPTTEKDNSKRECNACARQGAPSRCGRYRCCGAPRPPKTRRRGFKHVCGVERKLDVRARDRSPTAC